MLERYTYVHDPEASMEVNLRESMKMDPLRATMGPTSEKLRARALAGLAEQNGQKEGARAHQE
jgi:hypothetical protein